MPGESDVQRFETKSEEIVRVFHEETTRFYHLTLTIHKEGMELRASLSLIGPGGSLEREDFTKMFEALELSGTVNEENITVLCDAVGSGENVDNVLLIEGKYPVKGENQHIKFHVKPSSREPRQIEEYDERKDYHNLNLFENVGKNQLIAEVFPASDGVSGRTVTGAVVPAIRGLAFKRECRAGDSVITDDSGYKFFSKISGRVVYDQGKRVISVTDLYEIHGNVDYTTGNIDFVGEVIVHGDVTDTYNIRALKGVRVDGHVGNCIIDSDSDITIGGMDGGDIGFIRCGGNLKMKYVHGTTVECEGSIEITHESVHSKLQSIKAVIMPAGSIIGGEVIALTGVEANEIGSDAHIRTCVAAGISYIIKRRIADIRERLSGINAEIDRLNAKIDPFVTNPRNLMALNTQGREKIKEMAVELKKFIADKKDLEDELQKISQSSRADANPIISVSRSIEAGVVLTVGTTVQPVRQKVVQRMSIIENSESGGLRFTNYYPVTKRARDIEYAIVEQAKKKNRKE